MPKIFSERGFEFWIYTNDHPPAHSHIIRGRKKGKGKKAEVLIYLGNESIRPSVMENRGMKKSDVRKALAITCRRQNDLLTAWRNIYGD